MNNEKGFTFIELGVTMLIILVLAGIALGMFREYRKQGYEAVLESTWHDARNALEAGQANTEELAGQNLTAWTDAMGRFQGAHVDEFIPGLAASGDTWVLVTHNGACSATASTACPRGGPCCVVDQVLAKHCKGKLSKEWMAWNDGTVTKLSWNNISC